MSDRILPEELKALLGDKPQLTPQQEKEYRQELLMEYQQTKQQIIQEMGMSKAKAEELAKNFIGNHYGEEDMDSILKQASQEATITEQKNL